MWNPILTDDCEATESSICDEEGVEEMVDESISHSMMTFINRLIQKLRLLNQKATKDIKWLHTLLTNIYYWHRRCHCKAELSG
jgi:hypothetical protein